MRIIQEGVAGLKLVAMLNSDRILWPAAIATSLVVGRYFAGL
ncbi:hypothetical protein [Litoreibacter roseus]|nr:hypothetical protein [Litoreibacter roseus]